MKKLILLSLIVLTGINTKAQGIVKEKCKASEVTVQPYDSSLMTEKSIIVHLGNILLDKQAQSMEDLSEENLKEIRKWARQFKSCSVYVDFKEEHKDRKLNPMFKDEHLVYLVVRDLEK